MSVLGYLLPAAFLHGFSHLKLEIVVGYLSFRNFAHIFSHSNAWLRHMHSIPASVLLPNQIPQQSGQEHCSPGGINESQCCAGCRWGTLGRGNKKGGVGGEEGTW